MLPKGRPTRVPVANSARVENLFLAIVLVLLFFVSILLLMSLGAMSGHRQASRRITGSQAGVEQVC
jgi:hypothetical protein